MYLAQLALQYSHRRVQCVCGILYFWIRIAPPRIGHPEHAPWIWAMVVVTYWTKPCNEEWENWAYDLSSRGQAQAFYMLSWPPKWPYITSYSWRGSNYQILSKWDTYVELEYLAQLAVFRMHLESWLVKPTGDTASWCQWAEEIMHDEKQHHKIWCHFVIYIVACGSADLGLGGVRDAE
jgi:hypothetical protein